MAFQAFAKESDKDKQGGIHAMVINPGWVQTDMGGKNATKPVSESVQQILVIVDDYEKRVNGGFYNYNGNVFGW